MNILTEKGREVLIQAALRGHPTIIGTLHGKKGDCALGVPRLHFHDGQRADALK